MIPQVSEFLDRARASREYKRNLKKVSKEIKRAMAEGRTSVVVADIHTQVQKDLEKGYYTIESGWHRYINLCGDIYWGKAKRIVWG